MAAMRRLVNVTSDGWWQKPDIWRCGGIKYFLSSIVWAVVLCASGTAIAFDHTDLLKVMEFKECAGCDLSRVYLTETHLEGANNDTVGFPKVAGLMPESATSPDEPLDTSKVQLQMGPQVTLLGDGEFGLKYFPDMQVTVLQQTPTLILIMASTISMGSSRNYI